MSADVVLVSPSGRHPDCWTRVVQALPNGVKPWLPSTFGLSFKEQVAAVERFLDKNELRRVVLAGHGTGADVAATVAVRSPGRVRALVLSHPAGILPGRAGLRFVPAFGERRKALKLLADIDWPGKPLPERTLALLVDGQGLEGASVTALPRGERPYFDADPARLAGIIAREATA
ncbi:alpha/beta hydrolase [Corynebacterium vitaeruminis]|uniref:alpha/beta hydrolase n=1 Tax=Corynebacterium vitaeruminis TaxID=38305 RepID=UPI000691C436|nr:hypothetical protein [Corynebacterium vitaeruminis]